MFKSYHTIIIPNKLLIENWYYGLDEDIKPKMFENDLGETELRYSLLNCIIFHDFENLVQLIIQHCSILKYRCPSMRLVKHSGEELNFNKTEITSDEIYSFLF